MAGSSVLRLLPCAALVALVSALVPAGGAGPARPAGPQFQTSDRCMACHNGVTTPDGRDVSIGFAWRATMMANAARDPYWQAAVRREITDHPKAAAHIEDECSKCHMPMARYLAHQRGGQGAVYANLPFDPGNPDHMLAADGVSCSLCHQISKEKLGTPESLVGGFVIDPPDERGERREYGPFQVEPGHVRMMRSSSGGFSPSEAQHIRASEHCATCHTLYTSTLDPNGQVIGRLPEQVPYQEWLHSAYRGTQSCQDCHMPAVDTPVPVTRVLGVPREGVKRHSFVAGNFFMLRMLNRFRGELGVAALPQELETAANETVAFLESQAARVAVEHSRVSAGRLVTEVAVENLGGHKLPTAYPSRRVWLHVVVRDRDKRTVFESGRFQPDGSIQGNDNDASATAFEPHYTEIDAAGQVQIYEAIMADAAGVPTTGLLTALRYVKDNRVLPRGFDKRTAEKDIAVAGAAEADEDFAGGRDRVRYAVALGGAAGPFTVEAELWYQPIGFRWAANLRSYDSPEPRRFTAYYDSMAQSAALILARASATAE